MLVLSEYNQQYFLRVLIEIINKEKLSLQVKTFENELATTLKKYRSPNWYNYIGDKSLK